MNSKPESENSFILNHQASTRAADSTYATYHWLRNNRPGQQWMMFLPRKLVRSDPVLEEMLAINTLERTIQVYVGIMVAVSVGLLLVLAVFTAWRKRHPRFPAGGADEMFVICAGDSLTKGSLSANYLVALKRRLPRHLNFSTRDETATQRLVC